MEKMLKDSYMLLSLLCTSLKRRLWVFSEISGVLRH